MFSWEISKKFQTSHSGKLVQKATFKYKEWICRCTCTYVLMYLTFWHVTNLVDFLLLCHILEKKKESFPKKEWFDFAGIWPRISKIILFSKSIQTIKTPDNLTYICWHIRLQMTRALLKLQGYTTLHVLVIFLLNDLTWE